MAGTPVAKRHSVDELLGMLSDIASDPDSGADRLRAIKALLGAQSAGTTVPEPKTDEDISRMAILMMRWWGREATQAYWHQAFRRAKKEIHEPASVGEQFLSAEQRDRLERISSVKTLYKVEPRLKRRGLPKGYPYGKGPVVVKEFCRRLFIKVCLDDEQAKIQKEDDAGNLAAPELTEEQIEAKG
jgi:hypothetical protein